MNHMRNKNNSEAKQLLNRFEGDLVGLTRYYPNGFGGMNESRTARLIDIKEVMDLIKEYRDEIAQ